MKIPDPKFDPLFQQVAWGIQNDAFEDTISRVALRNYRSGFCDDLVAGILADRVRELQRKEALGERNPFRIPKLYRGELLLGREHIRMFLQTLTQGCLIVANTGSGKSNLERSFLVQLAVRECSLWMVENYKTEFRHLRPLFRRLGKELIILRAKDWKWNLLQALSDPVIHLSTALDLLSRILGIPPLARSILRQRCHLLYHKFGIWEGRKDRWPTLFDLYEDVKAASGLNESARTAILERLGGLLVSLTPKCAAYRLAWSPVDLARFSIAFEARGATEAVKQILFEPCLFLLFQHEVERGTVNGPLKLFICVDDGQRFFNQTGTSEITPMEELAGIIRGAGIGLCIAVQTVNGLPPKLISNLASKFAGRLGLSTDYALVGAEMGLDQSQLEWLKHHQTPGVFIAHLAQSDWRYPFLFRAPLLKIPATVTDLEADETLRALDKIHTVPAAEFEKWDPYASVETASKTKPNEPRLTEIELRFLKAVISNQNRSSSFYAKVAGINGRRAAEIRRQLVERGYLKEHALATGTRGRTSIILEALEPAFNAVTAYEGGLI